MAAPQRYSYAELRAATGDFAADRRLGAGGFGAVFRGELAGGEVAVKRLSQEAGPGTAAGLPSAEQFAAEVLGMAHYAGHAHLLPVIGYCDEDAVVTGGVRQSCIVYPLMPAGDLECRLRLAAAGAVSPVALAWWARLRIFREIFIGLVDLHDPSTGAPAQLFHRDVKTANVLLDSQLAAYLGDFGLARAMPGLAVSGASATARTHVSTANLIGTHQYMAPEYLSAGEISTKTDVFSCGVVGLELLTGRPSRPGGNARQDVREVVKDTLEALDDDGVTVETTQMVQCIVDQKAGDWPPDIAVQFAHICVRCLEEKKRKRPDSDVILKELTSLLDDAMQLVPAAVLQAEVGAQPESQEDLPEPEPELSAPELPASTHVVHRLTLSRAFPATEAAMLSFRAAFVSEVAALCWTRPSTTTAAIVIESVTAGSVVTTFRIEADPSAAAAALASLSRSVGVSIAGGTVTSFQPALELEGTPVYDDKTAAGTTPAPNSLDYDSSDSSSDEGFVDVKAPVPPSVDVREAEAEPEPEPEPQVAVPVPTTTPEKPAQAILSFEAFPSPADTKKPAVVDGDEPEPESLCLTQPEAPSGGAGGGVPSPPAGFECSMCSTAKPESAYSKNQLKKKEGRRCRSCVERSSPATVLPDWETVEKSGLPAGSLVQLAPNPLAKSKTGVYQSFDKHFIGKNYHVVHMDDGTIETVSGWGPGDKVLSLADGDTAQVSAGAAIRGPATKIKFHVWVAEEHLSVGVHLVGRTKGDRKFTMTRAPGGDFKTPPKSKTDWCRKGVQAIFQGRTGEVTMDPDRDKDVRLHFTDKLKPETSSYIKVTKLEPANASALAGEGTVVLFVGELQVSSRSAPHVRYKYELQESESGRVVVSEEWVGHQTEATRYVSLEGVDGPQIARFDDEIVFAASDPPRVALMKRLSCKWLWRQFRAGELTTKLDEFVSLLDQCGASCEVKGKFSTGDRGALKGRDCAHAVGQELRACIYQSKPTAKNAAALCRILYLQSSVELNSQAGDLIQFFEYCLQTWNADRSAVRSLSAVCQDRWAAALRRAMQAMQKQTRTGQFAWLLGMPLLHTLDSAADPPGKFGLCGLAWAGETVSSEEFLSVLDQLLIMKVFAAHPLLASTCLLAAPLDVASSLVPVFCSTSSALAVWLAKLNGYRGVKNQRKLEATVGFLAELASKEEHGADIPDVISLLADSSLRAERWTDPELGTQFLALAIQLLNGPNFDVTQLDDAVDHSGAAAVAFARPFLEQSLLPTSPRTFFCEMGYWMRILDVRLPEKPLVTWLRHIRQLLAARLRRFDDRDLLKWFCHTDSNCVTGATRECLADQVTDSVKALASEGAAAFKELFNFFDGPEISGLLSALVNKAWENALGFRLSTHEALVRHAVSWEAFPSFFSPQIQRIIDRFDERARQRLELIRDAVTELPQWLANCRITVDGILLLGESDKWKHVVTAVHNLAGADGPSVARHIEVNLGLRQEELREFMTLQEHLLNWVQMSQFPAACTDIDSVQELIQQPRGGTLMCDLTAREAGELTVRVFQCITERIPPAELKALFNCRESLVFQGVWARCGERANGTASIATWVQQIWTPVLVVWTGLHKDFQSGSIKISAARDHFAQTPDADLLKELKILAGEHDHQWCQARADDLRNSRTVDRNACKARAVVAVTETLLGDSCSGDADFQLICDLLKQDYESRPLKRFTAKLVQAFHRIESVSPAQTEAIACMANAAPLVAWLRSQWPDQEEFEAFISLANEWVEEDNDRALVADIHTVRNRCRALLYEVKTGSSLAQIVKACSNRELELEHLPAKILHCSERLHELIELKDKSERDIEGTSLVQAKAIFDTGTLSIVNSDTGPIITIQHRKLAKVDGDEYGNDIEDKTHDNATELRSKLMLVSGSGASDATDVQRDAISRFVELLSAGEAIAEILEKLSRAGCLTHRADCFEFKFQSLTCLIDARKRKTELSISHDQWLKKVDSLRGNYEAINLFRTVELCRFIELGRLIGDRDDPAHCLTECHEMLNLIRCVSKAVAVAEVLELSRIIVRQLPQEQQNLSHAAIEDVLKTIGVLFTSWEEPAQNDDDELHHVASDSDFFSDFLKVNQINVLISDDCLSPIFAIYSPHLPRADQVLLCTENTTSEMVQLLFRRCLSRPTETFCLTDVHAASYEVQVEAVQEFERLRLGGQFRLLVLAQHDNSHFCSALPVFQVPVQGCPRLSPEQQKEFVAAAFERDTARPSVLHVCGRSGDGKSHSIRASVALLKLDTNSIILTEAVTKDDLVSKLLEVELRRCDAVAGAQEPPVRARPRANIDAAVIDYLCIQGEAMGFRWPRNGCARAALAADNNRDRALQHALNHHTDSNFSDLIPGVDIPPAKSLEADAQLVQFLQSTGTGYGMQWGLNGCTRAAVQSHNDRDAAVDYCLREHQNPEFKAAMPPPSYHKATSSDSEQRADPAVVLRLQEAGEQFACNWSRAGCQRACIATTNSYDRAIEYVWDHCSDTDFDDPLPVASPAPAPASVVAVRLAIPPQVFVITISPTAKGDLSQLLFELFAQSELRSRSGRVFHRRPVDLFRVESTDGTELQMLEWLPRHRPRSPDQSIEAGHVEPSLGRSWHLVHHYLSSERNVGDTFSSAHVADPVAVAVVCGDIREHSPELADLTWQQVSAYVSFLSYYLGEYENNAFCQHAAEDLPGFNKFIATFLRKGAVDFSLPSLGTHADGMADNIAAYAMRRHWKDEDHPYISFVGGGFDFFGFHVKQDGNQCDPETNAVTAEGVMPPALAQALYQYKSAEAPRGLLVADYDNRSFWTMEALRQKLHKIMGIDTTIVSADPERDRRMEGYLLTSDNMKKILAIMYRFKVGLPVALCGSTGCGKTALVQYMCDAMALCGRKHMHILKVHGGITQEDIRREVRATMATARENSNFQAIGDPVRAYTVLFFDEVNTCEHQGYIKSLVVDNLLDGEPIPPELNLRFVCALNPYQKHTVAMIAKLEHAGLGYCVGAGQSKEAIGATPLRHLVYRVQPLPESMRNCVWDFGTLSADKEDLYIAELVRAELQRNDAVTSGLDVNSVATMFSFCLSESQKYARDECGDECGFVSLRDIERALVVFSWFYEKRQLLQLEPPAPRPTPTTGPTAADEPAAEDGFDLIDLLGEDDEDDEDLSSGATAEYSDASEFDPGVEESLPHSVTSCLILSLAVCYLCKLDGLRNQYAQRVASWLQNEDKVQCPEHRLLGPGGTEQVMKVIERVQNLFGSHLQQTLPDSVALNDALCENAFLMIVAIETGVPLFLVGKPGSSKSLAKSAVCDAMHGTGSRSEFFRQLKHVQVFSYQCSPLSRSEEIAALFQRAKKFQLQKQDANFVSCVVLDEIGLAEDSEHMPLKILHSLLEKPDGDERGVAFLGISNWALDPAKMNRGMHVNRSTPGHDDLVISARGICQRNARVMPLITSLARAYEAVYEAQRQTQFADFFGLRDFYTLVKMISARGDVDAQVLDDVVRRNFDGVDGQDGLESRVAIFHHFCGLQSTSNGGPVAIWSWAAEHSQEGGTVWCAYAGDISARLEMSHQAGGATEVNIDTERFVDLSAMRQRRRDNPEHRHRKVRRKLSQAAGIHRASPLELITSSLCERGVAARYLLVISQTDIGSSLGLLSENTPEDPVVLFGSSFAGDLEYQHLCRNINKVKLCMETGKTVVLLNLRSLYESLYELLNQYYITAGGHKWVEIGLGVHRVKCRVAESFRMIVIAEEREVLATFPIPLLNRLEKHVLSTRGVLSAEGTPAAHAAVATVEKWVLDFVSGCEGDPQVALREAFIGFTPDLIPAIVLFLSARTDLVDAVKAKLLQLATPDAVLRVSYSKIREQDEEIMRQYFGPQRPQRLREYVHKLVTSSDDIRTLTAITTHQHPVPTVFDVQWEGACSQLPPESIVVRALGTMDSESQLETAVTEFCLDKWSGPRLLVVQCTVLDLKVLTCAKYIVQSSLPALTRNRHIVFIIHLPQKCSLHDYTVPIDRWNAFHMDAALPSAGSLGSLDVKDLALNPVRLSDLIQGCPPSTDAPVDGEPELGEPEPEEPQAVAPSVSIRGLLKDTVQGALARLQFGGPDGTANITTIIKFFLKRLVISCGRVDEDAAASGRFCTLVESMVLTMLRKEEEERMVGQGKNWLKVTANNVAFVQRSGSFRAAIHSHMQRRISSVFAAVLAGLNTNGNLAKLSSAWWVDARQRNLFMTICESDMFEVEDEIEIEHDAQYICRSTFKHPGSVEYPFSWTLHRWFLSMRNKMEQLAGSKTTLQCLRDEMAEHMFVEQSDEVGCREYMMDFIRQSYDLGTDTAAVENIFTQMIWLVASTEAAIDSCVVTPAAIHVAAWKLESRLEQLLVLLSPGTMLGASSEFLDTLGAMIGSLGDAAELHQVDLTVLQSVVDTIKTEQNSPSWRPEFEMLRATIDTWARLSADSITSASAEEEHAAVVLDIDRLKALHLFHRVVGPENDPKGFLWNAMKDTDLHSPAALVRLIGVLNLDIVQQAEKDKFAAGLECASCGIATIAKRGVALPCGEIRHVFCAECIHGHFARHDLKFCPTCRQNLPESYVIDMAGDEEVVRAAGRVLDLRERCTRFFLEYVADFTRNTAGSTEVLDALWPVISGEGVSFSTEDDELELQDSPALRAHLLRVILVLDEWQPLLQKLDSIKSHGNQSTIDLLTLVAEALEDIFSRRLPPPTDSKEHADMLNELVKTARPLMQWDRRRVESRWLPPIAALRVVLFHLADELQVRSSGGEPNPHLDRVLHAAAEICKACVKVDRAPFMFLLKAVLQAHGRHTLYELASPAFAQRELLAAMACEIVVADPELPADVFSVCLSPTGAGALHTQVLRLCRDAGEVAAWLAEHCDDPLVVPMLSLAACRVAEEQYSVDQQGTSVIETLKTHLNGDMLGEESLANMLVTDCLNNELRLGAEGQSLPSRQATLLAIHAVAAASSSNSLTAPLGALAKMPASVAQCFFPTIRDDPKAAVMAMMNGGVMDAGDAAGAQHWYQCANGHPYYIGNCGQAVMARACPQCGAQIGGGGHRLDGTNRAAVLRDDTPMGYELPDEVLCTPVAERGLSVVGVTVVRVILHAILLGSVSVGAVADRAQRSANLLAAMHVQDPPTVDELAQWLRDRLLRSVAALATAISRNVDDAAQLCHVVLNSMMQHQGGAAPGNCLWATQESRRAWEQNFETLISPLILHLDTSLRNATEEMDAAANEEQGSARVLLHELQEGMDPERLGQPLHAFGGQRWPQLWRYRTRVTVEHFKQRFTAAPPAVRQECPAIAICLEARAALSALQYLPDILTVQRMLVSRFERRLSKQEAAETSLWQKLEAFSGDERQELERCVQSFLCALDAVRPVLNAGVDTVLKLEDELLTEPLTIHSALHFFLPATVGPGKVGVALSNFLLNSHNAIVRAVAGATEPPRVSIRSVRREHVVTLEDAGLLPLLFANVDRTIFEPSYGRGTRVEYDFTGIEDALRHHCFAGKPRIAARQGNELPTAVAFRNDVHAGHIMARLRENVRQEPLQPAVVAQVLTELGSAQRAAQVLRAVEIAIGFLHNSKGNPDMLLAEYLKSVLMMDEDLAAFVGPSAAKKIKLQHVAALVSTLDQQQAHEEVQSGRDCFVSQPEEYKLALDPAREQELRARIGEVDPLKLAPLATSLRTFIVEHLTVNNLEMYQPQWLLVDDLLVVLDELGEFIEALRGPAGNELGLRIGEAVPFWGLLLANGGAARRGRSAPVVAQAGTIQASAKARADALAVKPVL